MNSPEGRNPSFQMGKSLDFFKKGHLFSPPMFATSLAENSIKRNAWGFRDSLRFDGLFSFSPTAHERFGPEFFVWFFRVEDGRDIY